jgi:hypothetical protein
VSLLDYFRRILRRANTEPTLPTLPPEQRYADDRKRDLLKDDAASHEDGEPGDHRYASPPSQ